MPDRDTLVLTDDEGEVVRMSRQGAAPVPGRQARRRTRIPLPNGFYVYRCMDHQGLKDALGGPQEVFRMLIPNGWRFTGGVTWKLHRKGPIAMTRAEWASPAELSFAVSSPQQRVVLRAYPEVKLADITRTLQARTGAFPPGSSYMGAIVWPATAPEAFITGFVIPRQRGQLANARMVHSRQLPQLAALFDREMASVNSVFRGVNIGQVVNRAALVTVDYVLNGVPYREAFVVDLMYLQMADTTLWSPRLSLSVRAPRDEFDAWQPYVMTSINSFQINPRWLVLYTLLVNKASIKMGEVDRYIRKIDHEIWANRAKVNAQIHRDMYPVLAPFADFVGPDGKRRFLPTGTKHQIDSKGNIRSGDDLPETPGWDAMKLVK